MIIQDHQIDIELLQPEIFMCQDELRSDINVGAIAYAP
jgi:hypothetical protein